jgi:hypothetical protein
MLAGVADPYDVTTASLDDLAGRWSDAGRLTAELRGLGIDEAIVSSLLKHLDELVRGLGETRQLTERIRLAKPDQYASLDGAFRQLIRRWFSRKVVVIDGQVSGDQIVRRICEATPPGFLNRIMGLQNIKGVGLDFVYRWQAWEKCHEACGLLRSPKVQNFQEGLQMLVDHQEFGWLGAETIRATVEEVRGSPRAHRERFQAELDEILARLSQALQQSDARESGTPRRDGLWSTVLDLVEQFLDVADVVKRRRRASQIYRDLAAERISRQRAAAELRAINERQHGGWLGKRIRLSLRADPASPELPAGVAEPGDRERVAQPGQPLVLAGSQPNASS